MMRGMEKSVDRVQTNINNEVEKYIAREAGFNRYERIVDYDFSAGHAYWNRTKDFWADVRTSCSKTIQNSKMLRIKDTVSEKKLFQVMFQYADQTTIYNKAEGQDFIEKAMLQFIDSGED